MYQVGIDIGSSAAKVAVIKDDEVVNNAAGYRVQQSKGGRRNL